MARLPLQRTDKHPFIAETLLDIGFVSQLQGKHEEALINFTKALTSEY